MESKTASTLPRLASAGTYVYCVGWSEAFEQSRQLIRARAIGGQGDPVRAIEFMDIAAIVSDSPVTRFDVSRENTMAHQFVIEEVMVHSDVLPVRFSTVAKNDADIRERFLKRRYGELHYLLEHDVCGRVELGLKVLWNRERLFAEVVAADPQIRALRDVITGKPEEKTHYQRIQLGQITEEAIVNKRDQEAELILGTLRPLAVEVKANKILTDMMLLNASFLVDKADEPAFDAKVNEIDEAQQGRLVLKYVGPVPPYNFVNLVIRWTED